MQSLEETVQSCIEGVLANLRSICEGTELCCRGVAEVVSATEDNHHVEVLLHTGVTSLESICVAGVFASHMGCRNAIIDCRAARQIGV